ncbi:MAG TPA: hypothetical protein VFV71_11820 [Burkholderiales bacterium]|nr:hypothetical protein [Burkholderiales bacterium]
MTENRRQKYGTKYFWHLLLIVTGACLGVCDDTQAQQRVRNAASDRYVVNQTFDGQAFFKDNNVWVYTPAFAETFGMPPEGVDPNLNGIEAAAFRVEYTNYTSCGFGGKAENCRPDRRCVTDIYVDESKHPLPWATDQQADWLSDYNSSRWLKTPNERTTSPRVPEGIVQNKVINGMFTLRPFADPKSKREAAYFQDGDSPSKEYFGYNFVRVLGYKRAAISGLTMISLHFRCMKRNSEKKAINFRLEVREQIFSQPLALFHEFVLPEMFQIRIDEQKKASDEIEALYYRNLLENMKREKP